MKILMFAPQFAPLIGGAERQAEKLGQALSSQGLQVKVVTPRLVPGSPLHEVRGGLAVRRFELQDLARDRHWRGIGLFNVPWITLQIVTALWADVGRADVLHCHIGCLQSLAAALVARLRGKPVICKAAMADDQSDLGEMARNGLLSRLLAKSGRLAFTRWVATTQAVREGLMRAGVSSTRIVVIPNGVELMPTDTQIRKGRVRRFLYLGRLSSNIERDVPGLIKAFDQIAASHSDIELVIVGDGDLRADAQYLAAQCRHASRIQLPGADAAAKWLAWADAFVLPSKREGLSNALLEAMSYGLPCVATDIPPNREVLADGQCGLLVPTGDTPALERALASLVDDAHLAEDLGQRALERVRLHYGLPSVSSRYRALYAELKQSN